MSDGFHLPLGILSLAGHVLQLGVRLRNEATANLLLAVSFYSFLIRVE